MAQAELKPVIAVKGEKIDEYVKGICGITGIAEPPVGEVTQPQFNAIIRAGMNHLVRQYKRENYSPPNPE